MPTIPIGYQKASVSAAIIINNAAISGQQTSAGRLLEDANSVNRGFSVRFERGWAVECLLSVGFKSAGYGSVGYPVLKPEVHVTWPSSRHEPLSAVAALDLAREVTAVAVLIELSLSREQILDRDEKAEPEKKAE